MITQLITETLPLPLATLTDAWREATSLIERGGFVMWPLLVCSLIGLAVALERSIVFARFRARRLAGEAIVDAMLARLQQGQPDEAAKLCRCRSRAGRLNRSRCRHHP